ncbi:MAG TPA: sulfatase-like hydrolase/transferase, partial [Tepidisphaeraceae bacterium]|nr:sulfatase-like hydrolase/transferase [Tepidisphaeraceae bacterium]
THRPVGDLAVAPRYIESRNRSTFEQMERQAGTGKWSMEKEIKRAGIGTGPYQTADELATLGALRVIQEHFNSSMYDRPMSHQPLLLKVSLVQPHYPYFTDETKFNYYLNRVPIFIEPRAGATLTPKHAGVAVNVDPREIRRATAAYYGMIETVDAQFRRVCDALEQVGQNLDDWIIIYTSDHGEMLGEHGLWEKSCFYEAAVRVPLLIRCPSRFSPRVCSENVNLVDLFATICELSGSPIPPSLDSRSLLPLLHGDAGAWDNYTLSLDAGTRLMIKHDHLKYQHNGGEYPEILFDLETDPSERVNRMGDPRYQDAVQRFRAQRAALPGFTELSRTVAGAAPAGSSS